jgi:hypothetical protein
MLKLRQPFQAHNSTRVGGIYMTTQLNTIIFTLIMNRSQMYEANGSRHDLGLH